ncbi:hypothetical protein AALB39_04320 [Lachnospiraceae bacterium 54-53]
MGSWYLHVLYKVNEAKKTYNALKQEPYNEDTLEKIKECRAIIGIWGAELRRLEY